MTLEQLTHEQDGVVRQYTYDDESVLAIDLGAHAPEAAVDVADGTVMVVLRDTQYEFELPADVDNADTFMKNGVLTIEMEASE